MRGWPAAASEAPRRPHLSSAKRLIEKTVQVLAVLRDTRATRATAAQLEKIAHEHLTSVRWRRAGARLEAARRRQRDEFVDQFTTYLASDYGSRIDRYHQEDVKVMGEQSKPRGDVEVRTKIVGGANDGALVDYRMRKGKDGWRIIDVVIEGISLVANFRDQFREVIARGGPEALLQKLKEKNAAAAAA